MSISAKSTATMIHPTPQFMACFDTKPFEFRHELASHPLFKLDRLLELAIETAQQRPYDLYYDVGVTDLNQRWNESSGVKPSVEKAIENIENSGAWVILKRAEANPEYAELLAASMAETQRYIGRDLSRDLKVAADSIIFITSPQRLTTYHIDRECSFLLQIQGEKQINIFDRADRDVLTESELEAFWSVDNNAPRYRPEFQDRAQAFTLRPNTGIHIPVNFPHWLQNGNDVSISYNINCQFKDSLRANLYKFNHVARKLGFNPQSPGESKIGDGVKNVVSTAYNTLRRSVRLATGKRDLEFHI